MLSNKQWLWPVLLAATIGLVGCGGGGGGSAAAPPPPDIGRNVSDLVAFIQGLIAGTDESSAPIDINPLTLVTDDTAEPTPL
jgi:hypothetical protein